MANLIIQTWKFEGISVSLTTNGLKKAVQETRLCPTIGRFRSLCFVLA
jgi:hypothetical protein